MADTERTISTGNQNDAFDRKNELQGTEEKFQALFESLDKGFCIIQMLFDENENPIDYRFLKVNSSFKRQASIKDVEGKRVRELAPDLGEYWLKVFGKVALTGESVHFEHEAQTHKDRRYEVYAYSFGEVENHQVALFFSDISEREKIQKQLIQREQRLQLAIDAAEIGLWDLDLKKREADISPRLAGMLGFAPDKTSLALEEWNEILLDNIPDLDATKAAAIEKDTTLEFEFRISPKGTEKQRWLQAWTTLVKDDDGNPERFCGVLMDITDRKEAEQERRRNEERAVFLNDLSDALRRLTQPKEIQAEATRVLGEHLQANRVMFAEVDPTGEYVTVEEDYSNGVPSLLGSYDLEDFGSRLLKNLNSNKVHIANDIQADPHLTDKEKEAYHDVNIGSILVIPLMKKRKLVAVLSVHQEKPRVWADKEVMLAKEASERIWDMIERARSEAALSKSERKYRKLFDSIDEGFCIIEKVETPSGKQSDYRYFEVNPAFEEQSGMRDAVGKTIREIAPDINPKLIDKYDRVLDTGESNRFEIYLDQFDRILNIYAFKIGIPRQQRIAVLFNDITARKQTEDRLRESEEHFRLAVEVAGIGTWHYKKETKEVYFDKRMRSIWGEPQSREYIPLTEVLQRVHSQDRPKVTEAINMSLNPDNLIDSYSVEFSIIWDDGSVHWLSANGQAQFKEGDRRQAIGFFGTALDITEQKRNEERLISLKDKLDSDLAVMTRLHELSLRLTATTDLQPMLEEILEAAIELQNADFGSIQLYDQETNSLEIYSQQGFGPEFEEFYSNSVGMGTACSIALEEGRRIIIEDVEKDPSYKNNQENALRFGYRAVQSTPLFDRAGNALGMLSTHFKKPHRPSKSELRFTDLYARQAADMIDLKLSEEKLRASEEKLQSINETLEERVEERTAALLSYQNQLRSLATQLSKAEEKERQRLASDLHDNLGQILAVCKIKIDLLQKEEYDSEIAEASELVDEAIRYTRELMSDLKPPPSLNDEDLKAAMEWVAKKMEKHNLKVTIIDDDQPKNLSQEVRATLLRSARELLFNVVKHSGVSKAWLKLARVEDQVQVVIEDKGKGFDAEKQESTESLDSGFGLFNISERMDLLKGSLKIESEPGKGTKAILTAPLLEEEEYFIEDENGATELSFPAILSSDSKGNQKIKVLLADDHQIMREGLRKIIEGEKDLTIIGEASDGKEAIQMAEETSPDVIVMDVNMPEMNGILATQEIKSKYPAVQIVGLSLHNDEDVAREMRKVGASAYLTKSDAFETLCATIRSEAMSKKS